MDPHCVKSRRASIKINPYPPMRYLGFVIAAVVAVVVAAVVTVVVAAVVTESIVSRPGLIVE